MIGRDLVAPVSSGRDLDEELAIAISSHPNVRNSLVIIPYPAALCSARHARLPGLLSGETGLSCRSRDSYPNFEIPDLCGIDATR